MKHIKTTWLVLLCNNYFTAIIIYFNYFEILPGHYHLYYNTDEKNIYYGNLQNNNKQLAVFVLFNFLMMTRHYGNFWYIILIIVRGIPSHASGLLHVSIFMKWKRADCISSNLSIVFILIEVTYSSSQQYFFS